MAKTKPPKSELASQGESHILFAADDGCLGFEKNVGQRVFADSPSPKTDFLVVQLADETWFLSKPDAQILSAWLQKALS